MEDYSGCDELEEIFEDGVVEDVEEIFSEVKFCVKFEGEEDVVNLID